MMKAKIEARVDLSDDPDQFGGLWGVLTLSLKGPGGELKHEYQVEGEDEEEVYRKLDRLFTQLSSNKKRIVKGKTLITGSIPNREAV